MIIVQGDPKKMPHFPQKVVGLAYKRSIKWGIFFGSPCTINKLSLDLTLIYWGTLVYYGSSVTLTLGTIKKYIIALHLGFSGPPIKVLRQDLSPILLFSGFILVA